MSAVTGLARGMQEVVEQTGLWFGREATSWHIIGRRTGNFSTTSFNDCGDYFAGATFPKVGVPLEVLSSSALDTAGGGTARSVRIVYLDTANTLQTATYALNGTTPVPVVDMNYVQWMEVDTAAVDAVAAGNISLRVVASGTVVEQILANTNRSLSGRACVPAGWTGYVTDWDASCVNQEFEVRLRATRDSYTKLCTPGVWHFLDIFTLEPGGLAGNVRCFRLGEGTDIKLSARPLATSGGPRVEGGFTLVLVRNT